MTLTRVPGLLFGGDYTPDQWTPQTWTEDIRLMKESGVNIVTLPVFGWAGLQSGPGVFTFEWLDDILDRLANAGIAVDLATATASPPAWLIREHPEILPVTADGVRLEFGSRQHYCPTSTVFRAATVELATAMADRYKNHPAVVMWHISNEYGDHITECFCTSCACAFRRWLLERHGDLAGINAAWGTAFWGQRYDDVNHIEPPRTAPGPVNPGQALDWRRFCSDALRELFVLERDAIRATGSTLPVTTNFMSMMKQLDYWAWAAEEDIVSDDAYPDPADPLAACHAAMNYDLMRSLAGGPWLLLEHAISAVSWRDVNVPKRPDQSFLHSIQTLARGSDGVMFFQWRASRLGAEKFHSALLPHGGTRTRGWQSTMRLGSALQELADIADTTVESTVAIVMDWDNWWALEGTDHPSERMQWLTIVRTWYEALWRRGLTATFVRPGDDLTGYPLVLAPNAYLTTNATAAWLQRHIESGATALIGPFSGVVDDIDAVHPNGPPGPLGTSLGIHVDEYWPIPDGASVDVRLPDGLAVAQLWHEWIEVTDATVVAEIASGDLTGRPALTRHEQGAGHAWYLAAHLDADGIGRVLDLVSAGLDLPARALPADVEWTERRDGSRRFVFVLNHSRSEVVIDVPAGVDRLTGLPTGPGTRIGPESLIVVEVAA